MILYITLLMLIFFIFIFIVDFFKEKNRCRKIDDFIKIQPKSTRVKFIMSLFDFNREHRVKLEQRLLDAGYYNKNLAKYYFPIKLSIIFILSGVVFIIDLSILNKIFIIMPIIITIIVLPDMILELRRKALIRKISAELPYLLDLMSVCIQTGMTIEAALNYLGDELKSFNKDLSFQIKLTSDSANIHGLEKALNNLSNRLPTTSVRSFVLTIIQNLQYGTSIAQVLGDLSEDMRKAQIIIIEEKVGKLSAKMSIPLILFIMFPIVILILAPGVMQLTSNIGG